MFTCKNSSDSSSNEGVKKGKEKKTELTERQKRRNEVMEIHDEMMPAFFSVQKVQKEIETKLKDTSLELTDQQKTDHATAHALLLSAEKEMRIWMKQWKEPAKEDTDDVVFLYLKKQMKEVELMKKKMETSIDMAKKHYNFTL